MATDYTIKTKRLVLAPLTLDDTNNLHELWTHPEVRRYLWDDTIIPLEQTATIIHTSINHFRDEGTDSGVHGCIAKGVSRRCGN